MTPTEQVVAEVIRQEREDLAMGIHKQAIYPRVMRRTGVSETTYFRVLRIVNTED